MDIGIIAGRRGEAYAEGGIVARVGQWDARTFPGGDWEGTCECEWYAGNDEEAFRQLTAGGTMVYFKLYDYNEACHEGDALAILSNKIKSMGDVAMLELTLKGTGLKA